jgi:hypothetical protein
MVAKMELQHDINWRSMLGGVNAVAQTGPQFFSVVAFFFQFALGGKCHKRQSNTRVG